MEQVIIDIKTGIVNGKNISAIAGKNEYGFSCNYDIYRTENVGLGKLDFEIK